MLQEMEMTIHGVRYHIEISGDGEELLLLHGFTGSAGTWRAFRSSWETRYRVITVDLLGHGRTEAPSDASRYATEQAVRDLTAILDQLSIDRAHVLGYSMGGRLALSLAMLAPHRLRSLTLESSSPGIADAAERAARRQHDEQLATRIERDGITSFVDYWESIPLFATMRSLSEEIRQTIRAQRLANRSSGLAGCLRGMGTGTQPSWWDRLDQLSMPVHLIAGELDTKFTVIAEQMHKQIPDCKLTIVPEAGHTVHVEQAEIFDTIVMSYLESIDKERMK